MKKTAVVLIILYIGIHAFSTTFSNTYDTETPVGTDLPSVLDDRIREAKAATAERLNVDHFFDEDPDGKVQASQTGGHRKITLGTLTATPTVNDSQGKVAFLWINSGGVTKDLYYTHATATVRLTASNTTFTDTDDSTIEFVESTGVRIKASGVTENEMLFNAVHTQIIASGTITETDIGNLFGVLNDRDQDGSADTVSENTEYDALTDGFVTIIGHGGTSEGGPVAVTVSSSGGSPTTVIAHHDFKNGGINNPIATVGAPITKGSHWRTDGPNGVGASSTVFWQPIGQ